MRRMSVIGTAFVAIVLASCGSDPDHAAAPYADTTAPAAVTMLSTPSSVLKSAAIA